MPKSEIQKNQPSPPNVVALVYEGLCTFEFGIVAEVFGLARPELGKPLYDFKSVSLEAGPLQAAGGLTIQASGTLDDLDAADMVIIPGWRGKDSPVPNQLCAAIQRANERGALILSICSGVYVLAAAGVLAHLHATTHWRYVDDLHSKYPDIKLQTNALYVDAGNIITSAGSTAGLDACLHVVRRQYGAKITNMVARRLVMHSYRQGGQAQFIEPSLPKVATGSKLANLMEDMRRNLAQSYSVTIMAASVGMSPRTFQRQFLAVAGAPALQWLTKERVLRSCILLETTHMDMDSIAQSVGMASAETLRYHFRQILDLNPTEYRKRFAGAA